jgi:hypothetical protein
LDDFQQILVVVDEIEDPSKRKFTTKQILQRAHLFWEKDQQQITTHKQKNSARLESFHQPLPSKDQVFFEATAHTEIYTAPSKGLDV